MGSFFIAQGHALKFMQDHTNMFTLNVTNSVAGDPTQIFIRSADQNRYLLCISNMLCERAVLQGSAGNWEKMQLRPAVAGNHYCFHIYAPSNQDPLPICFDEETGSLMQAQPEAGCEPAVFAMEKASSALLLQEIMDLTAEVSEQKTTFEKLQTYVAFRARGWKDTPLQHCAEAQKLSSRKDAAEEKLVFLEDNLSFVREQLQSNLQDAGAGTAHGLPEAFSMPTPDAQDPLLFQPELCKSSKKSGPDTHCSPFMSSIARVIAESYRSPPRLL